MILRFFQFICFIILGRLNPEIETFLNQTTSQFNSILSGFADHYVSHSELERLKETLKPSYIKLKKTWIPKKHRLYNDAQTFLSIYPKMDDVVAKKNSEFVEAEKTRYSTLLSTVDGKSLDDQQRTVVVTGEDYNLVIAGAGSGKTLTIAGKVKYLCEAKGVKPEDILLIAFTRKSAGEMQERIQERLGIQIDAITFHKLGLRIIAEAQNEKPDYWLPSTLKKILSNEKYIGDALLQKTVTTDFLNKKRVANKGIVPQYYVEGSHECCPYVNTMNTPRKARNLGIFGSSPHAHTSA